MSTTTMQENPIGISHVSYEVEGRVAKGDVFYDDGVHLVFTCRGSSNGVRTRIADANFNIPITAPARAFALSQQLRADGVFERITG